jgi:ABC-type methionine transport system permease subunit
MREAILETLLMATVLWLLGVMIGFLMGIGVERWRQRRKARQ